MTQTTLLNYEAPWPVYGVDWCKTCAPGQQLSPRSAFRLAVSSLTEDYRNRIAIAGLQDERVLVEDDYAIESDFPDFVTHAEAHHGYPATAIQWMPASATLGNLVHKQHGAELLCTTGEALKLWEYVSDGVPLATRAQGFVGRQPTESGHRLREMRTLNNSKSTSQANPGAPITNFAWNEKSPKLIVTSSIDTTCTVWNLDTYQAVTQLIAHDREVYDVAWLPGSTDIFVSVGADGSLRAFDLRSLEHSTILYETPAPKPNSSAAVSAVASGRPPTSPLLRIAFNPADSNYMATFHMEGDSVQILDMRSPGQPVIELRAHRTHVNALSWGSAEQPLLATAGDDCQLLLWDLQTQMAQAQSSTKQGSSGGGSGAARGTNSPRPSEGEKKKRIVTEPYMAYSAHSEINNLCWSPQIAGMTMNTGHSTAPGEWVAIAMGKSIKTLKV